MMRGNKNDNTWAWCSRSLLELRGSFSVGFGHRGGLHWARPQGRGSASPSSSLGLTRQGKLRHGPPHSFLIAFNRRREKFLNHVAAELYSLLSRSESVMGFGGASPGRQRMGRTRIGTRGRTRVAHARTPRSLPGSAGARSAPRQPRGLPAGGGSTDY